MSARRRLIAGRLPIFAAFWLPAAAIWGTVLALGTPLGPLGAAGGVAVHALILAAAIAVCRADPSGPRVLPVVMAACILLGITTTALFWTVGGDADFLAFVHLMLYLVAALCFNWGWRPELALWFATVVPWFILLPSMPTRLEPTELVAGIFTGSVVCLAVAEGALRAFATTHRHRRAEDQGRREVEVSRDAYRDLAEQAHEPIFTTDGVGRLTYVNGAFARCVGVRAETVVGRPVADFLTEHPANQPLRRLLVGPGAAGSPLPALEFEARTVNGLRWFETLPGLVRNADRRPVGVHAICRDVTERKLLERERDAVVVREHAARVEAERAREEAEGAARARDDFLAMLSHELRSPLHTVLAWSRMLRSGLVEPDRIPHALQSIEEAASAQARLVADLLDISRIAAGKFSLHLEQVDLATLIDARVDALRATATEKDVVIETRLERDLGAVRGDPTRLLQVFENLLTNAIKFTPSGGCITVSLHQTDGEAEVIVADTGIGIAADVLPHVFELFEQAEVDFSRRLGGLGLGLAIAKRLVDLHGGTIDAESPGESQGATFRVRLPLAVTTSRWPETLRPGRPGGRRTLTSLEHVRVLVVDDQVDARDVIATLLSRCGAEVRSAGSVREALERMETNIPDVVVADLMMPGEDGYELLRKLRASGRRVHAIAVTALASPEDRERAMDSGFEAHLAKPVDPTELVDVVARTARAGV